MELGGGAFGGWFGHEDWEQVAPLFPSRSKVVRLQLRRPLLESHCAGSLISDFQNSGKEISVGHKPPRLWCLVIAAQMNKDKH